MTNKEKLIEATISALQNELLLENNKLTEESNSITSAQIAEERLEEDDLLEDLQYAYETTSSYDMWLNEVNKWIYDGLGLVNGIMKEFDVGRSKAVSASKKLYKLISE